MVLIVASILFAFALDSWWDQRRERVEEAEILQGLKEEFLHNRSKLEERIAQHGDNLRGLEVLVAASRRGYWDSAEFSVDRALAALISPPTTDLGAGVLDALISSGRMELLTNRKLRVRLAAWEGVFEEVRDDEVMSRQFVFATVLPYLIRWGVPLSGPMSTWPDQWSGSFRSVADDPEALARLLSDPEFASLLETRYGFKRHASGEYRAAIEAVDGILAEIDATE
jgi:hypothetical protein